MRSRPQVTQQTGTSSGQIDPRAFTGWGQDQGNYGYDWAGGEWQDIYDEGFQGFTRPDEFGQDVAVTGFDMMGGGPNKWEQLQQSGYDDLYGEYMGEDGKDGAFATAQGVRSDVFGRDPRLAGGADAPSFLTGFGKDGQISDYQRALGFDRSVAEDVYTADAEKAMALARRGEGDMAFQMMGAGGGDPSVLRSGAIQGEAYGDIASNRAKALMGWDTESLGAARRAMEFDITNRDARIRGDEDALSRQDQINLMAANQYGDPSNQMNFLQGVGDIGAQEREQVQGGNMWDYGQHMAEQGFRPQMLEKWQQFMGDVPFDEATVQEMQQTEEGRSMLANVFGIGGAIAGGVIAGGTTGGLGTVGGAAAGYTLGSAVGGLFG